jgi:hypothetical protein
MAATTAASTLHLGAAQVPVSALRLLAQQGRNQSRHRNADG